MRNAVGANIINIASIYGFLAPYWQIYENTKLGNPAAYGVTKAGLVQFTRWLSTTLAPEIRANAISPGGIFRDQPANFVERYAERTPVGRMACEDDFRGALAYLSSDLSKYVTGQNVIVDGGWSAS
jgi:NAD(P)-dependent dehydrogenase (short-subunit alcohol dehydrogenase family)